VTSADPVPSSLLVDPTRPTIDHDAPGVARDPWSVYAWLRVHEPVHWSAAHQSWFLLRFADVRAALVDPRLTSEHPFRASRQMFGPSMVDCDHGAPRQLKALLRPCFSVEAARRAGEDVVRPIVEHALDELAAAGGGDFVASLAVQVPMRVALRLIGLPEQHWQALHRDLRPVIRYLSSSRGNLAAGVEARDRLEGYLSDALDAPHREDSPTMRDQLLRALRERHIERQDAVSTLLLLLAASTETTVATIANMLMVLVERSDVLQRLHREPELLPAVVRETLRWEPPVHNVLRFASEDLDIAGVPIARGDAVQLCLASANRDSAHYLDAERWDPDREERIHLSFAAGQHACLGMSHGLRELETVLDRVVQRFAELRLDPQHPSPVREGVTFRQPRHLWLRVALRR
jgi:cytochrome P450